MTVEERLARAEDMLRRLAHRSNGHIEKGHQQAVNAACTDITAERGDQYQWPKFAPLPDQYQLPDASAT
jgi:hypothetical protein